MFRFHQYRNFPCSTVFRRRGLLVTFAKSEANISPLGCEKTHPGNEPSLRSDSSPRFGIPLDAFFETAADCKKTAHLPGKCACGKENGRLSGDWNTHWSIWKGLPRFEFRATVDLGEPRNLARIFPYVDASTSGTLIALQSLQPINRSTVLRKLCW